MYPKPEHYYPTYWVIHLSRRGLTKTKELTIEFNLKDPWYIFPESVLRQDVCDELGVYSYAYLDIKVKDTEGTVYPHNSDGLFNVRNYDWNKNSKESPLIIEATDKRNYQLIIRLINSI